MRGAATEEATAATEPAGPALESTLRWGQAECDDNHFSIARNLRFERSELLHLMKALRQYFNLGYDSGLISLTVFLIP